MVWKACVARIARDGAVYVVYRVDRAIFLKERYGRGAAVFIPDQLCVFGVAAVALRALLFGVLFFSKMGEVHGNRFGDGCGDMACGVLYFRG